MLQVPRLVLVTDRNATAGRDLLAIIERALAGGVDAVQLREKELPGRVLCELGEAVRSLCHRYRAALLVNDRIDVARAIDADGVQLPEQSFAPSEARELLGPYKLIGVSRHALNDLAPSSVAGANFVVFGPVFETPSKRVFGNPLGVGPLAEAVARSPIPVLAIGGITPENVAHVAATGAHGVAVIRAILADENPSQAAQELRKVFGAS